MKIMAKLLIATICLLLAASNSFAIGLEVAAGGWNQSSEGQFSYKSVLAGDQIDLENDAGYTDQDRFIGRIKIELPVLPNFYFMGTPMEFEGDGNKTFSFGDVNITGDLYSQAKFDHYDLALYYGVPLTGLATLGTVGIDLGINVRKLDIEMVVTDKSNPSITDSVNETLYVPMGFLAVQIEPTDKLALEFELRGVAYDDNSYYDVIGRLKYRFLGLAFAAAGWRHEALEVNEKDIIADVTVSGPFVEGGVQF